MAIWNISFFIQGYNIHTRLKFIMIQRKKTFWVYHSLQYEFHLALQFLSYAVDLFLHLNVCLQSLDFLDFDEGCS